MHSVGLFLVAQLLVFASACPFHLQSDHNIPLNNERRSLPRNCQRTAIENISVFDGKQFTSPRSVCFDNGYIIPQQQCHTPAVTVNGTGKFLIPGLIDAHIHLQDVQTLENYSSYGCTTALQMNCRNFTQCAIMAKQPGLSSFIYAGLAAVGNGSLHAAQDPTRPKNTLLYPNSNVTEYVDWQFTNGSNFHKIVAEPNGPTLQQQTDMVHTAHSIFKKQTMTHASTMLAYIQAADSKTDGVQHVPDDGIVSAATIQQIKSQGQFVTPTLNVFQYAYSDPVLSRFFAVSSNPNRTLAHAITNAQNLYRAGVPMVAGTDAVGVIPQPNNTAIVIPYGLTLHKELENLVKLVGMSPAEAINAATVQAARWHRLHDRGQIKVGLRADLVMLSSNPLNDIANTQDLHRVWVKGIEVEHLSKRG